MILCTGAAGFIGSNLCYKLVGLQADVVVIDKLSPQSNRGWTIPIEKPAAGRGRVIFKHLDLCDKESLAKVFQEYQIEYIFHLAAESHVDRSIASPAGFWDSNVIGTFNLLHMADGYSVPVLNQISDEVFGPKPEGYSKEEDRFNPTSPYACSKAAQYFVGKSFAATYGLPLISTFPSNCYGPRQHSEKLVPKFIGKLLRGERVPLMSSTHFQRDWLAVDDMCDALIFLMQKGIPGDYNVGADNHHANLEITQKLLALTGRDESAIEIVSDRLAHDSRYAVDSSKIRALGWRPQKDFDTYLASTVEWFKDYLGGVRNV